MSTISHPYVKLKITPDFTIADAQSSVSTFTFENTHVHVSTLDPGWVFSNSSTGTHRLCNKRHVGYCVQGSIRLVFRDEFAPDIVVKQGEAFDIQMEHDALVEGNDLCILVTTSCRTCAGFEAAKKYDKFSQGGCCDL